MTDRLRRKWARAKLGREIVTQSSAISRSLTNQQTNPQTPNPETTNAVTTNAETTNEVTTNKVTTNEVTTNDVTTNGVTTDPATTNPVTTDGSITSSVQPTTSPGRIATLDFSPILKFDNPISKYIGRNFRAKNAPPSVRKILATTTGPMLPKRSKIPKRFLRGQVNSPPTILKLARNTNTPAAPISLAANDNSVHARHVTMGPLTPTVGPTSPSIRSILDQYPPSKVLFHEKNSTRKFPIKLWDTVPFQGDREIPKGMNECLLL